MRTQAGALQSTPSVSAGHGESLGARIVHGRRALIAAALGTLLLIGVLSQMISTRSPLPAVSRSHALTQRWPQRSLLSLPLAARGPVSAALGADQSAYLVSERPGGLSAANAAQHLNSSFTSTGVSVSAGATHLGLALRGLGYGSKLGALRPVAPRASGNRVTYARPGVSEWYSNGPLGLEQGFTLSHAPAGAHQAQLTISMALSANARASLDGGAQGVTLTRAGKPVLHYAGLSATDARGRRLHSWLGLHGGLLLVHVDTTGARYPLRIDPFVQAELTASDGAANDFLGFSVAISGETIAVGAPGRRVGSHAEAGEVYVFEEPGTGWANATQTAELTASDGATEDVLGYSVGVSGNTIVSGGYRHQVGANKYQGAVYVYERPGGGWTNATQTAELTASDGAESDELGWSVAVSGETIVAGAPFHKLGANKFQGAAYVYEKPGGGWTNATQTAELTASDGAEGDRLGYAVAISGETVVAGAFGHKVGSNLEQGAAYVYERPGGGWTNATQNAELTASDGAESDALGYSVAASGETVVAGAWAHKVGANAHQGAAYVYERPGGGWTDATQNAELTASDGAEGNEFGYSVAASGEIVVVAAPLHAVGSNIHQGAVYVYERPGGGWTDATQTAELTAPEGAAGDVLGDQVAVSGTTVLAGAETRKIGSNIHQGAAYVFSSAAHAAPVVETGKASSITETAAKLKAVVNPDGANVTECTFEYGTTPAYGSSLPCSALPGSGETPVAVSVPISGLTASSTYHFRITAASADGTSEGADETFTTLAERPPEPKGQFGRCVKVLPEVVGRMKIYHGGYTTAKCVKTSEAHNGKFEWEAAVLKPRFTVNLTKVPITLESAVRSSKVVCSFEAGEGEYTGLNTVGAITLHFKGCELTESATKCESPLAAPGEIVTTALEGELGVITVEATSSENKLGLDIFPVGRVGPLMEFKCGVSEVAVQGSVIVPVKANKMSLTQKLKFKAKNGAQTPEAFAGEPKDVLEESFKPAPFEQTGLSVELTQTNEEKVEINSVV